jgi:hypothetical protein
MPGAEAGGGPADAAPVSDATSQESWSSRHAANDSDQFQPGGADAAPAARGAGRKDAANGGITEAAATGSADEVESPRHRQRSRPTSSEPRIERVVVRPDQPEDAAGTSSSEPKGATPTRKGWWQRKLSGE